MNKEELLRRAIGDSGDPEGIKDRFMGNAQLYDSCFREFLQEENFAALAEAIRCGDCKKAFSAAHALKGISGNLGVTAFYEAICALVESLRAGDMTNADRQYAAVLRQKRTLDAYLPNETEAPTDETLLQK